MKQQIKYLTSRKVRGRIVPSLATVFNLFSLILLQFFGERPSKLTAAGESKKEAKGRNVCIRAMTSVFLVVVASNFWMFETTTEENEEKKHNGTEDKIFANNCKDRNELVEQKKNASAKFKKEWFASKQNENSFNTRKFLEATECQHTKQQSDDKVFYLCEFSFFDRCFVCESVWVDVCVCVDCVFEACNFPDCLFYWSYIINRVELRFWRSQRAIWHLASDQSSNEIDTRSSSQ